MTASASALGLMFPGQGTQRRGMGRWTERASPAAAAVFDLGNAVVGRDLRQLCFQTPDPRLALTANAQIAVFTCNLAAAAMLRERGVCPDVVVGHSVGEMNALCEAGTLTLEDGFRLVAARGALMATVRTPGAMAMVLGLSASTVDSLTRAVTQRSGVDGLVVTAIVNGPTNVVVSGTVEGVLRLATEATRAGARSILRLQVSGGFHSPLMDEIREEWQKTIAGAAFWPPRLPVVVNTTGGVTLDPELLRAAAVDQLTTPVRWVDAIHTIGRLANQVLLVEAGASKVLSSLVRDIDPAITTVSMYDPRTWDRARKLSIRGSVPR
jgi:[acyl-carrier-protein] S-malonyltransferase